MSAPVLAPAAAGASRDRRVLLHLHLVANETEKGLRLWWRRRSMTLTTALAQGVVYLAISLFVGGGHVVRPVMVLALPTLLASVVAVTATLGGSGGIAEEVNAGTLEQSQLGLSPPELAVLGRLAAWPWKG
jgi:ABC-2 type transport system permease protein